MLTMLFLGSAGPEVEVLHQMLVEQGYDVGEDEWSEPRTFGPSTEVAVRHFQQTHLDEGRRHLKADGSVGPRTWWALEHPSGGDQDSHLTDSIGPSQTPSNAVAAAALDAAWGELRKNVREVPDGSNRGPDVDVYTGMAGKGYDVNFCGPPWCAYFASWCFSHAPGGSPFGRQGMAQAIVAYCERHVPRSVVRPLVPGESLAGRIRPGDVGVLLNGQVHGHVVLISAVQGSDTWTVEGNSGNRVRSRRRPAAQYGAVVNFDAYAKDLKI